MKPQGYWFTSSKFEIEPGEDDEINPGIYGRRLAGWLKERLEQRGYTVEAIVNEDWGRCLICGRDPFMLWVGCASITEDETATATASGEPPLPPKEHIVWHCFAMAEVPFLKKLLGKTDTEPAVAKLDRDLKEILRAEPAVTLVPEP